jgi:hypothetical protein
MDVRRDPNLRGLGGRIGETFGSLYAPPSMTEVAGIQRARAAAEENARVAAGIDEIGRLYGPQAAAMVRAGVAAQFQDFERSRLLQNAPIDQRIDGTYGNYTQSPGGQRFAEGAATGRTVIEQTGQNRRNAADNARAIAQTAVAPLSEGQIRPAAPSVADAYGVPEFSQPVFGTQRVRQDETLLLPQGGASAAPAPPSAAIPNLYQPPPPPTGGINMMPGGLSAPPSGGLNLAPGSGPPPAAPPAAQGGTPGFTTVQGPRSQAVAASELEREKFEATQRALAALQQNGAIDPVLAALIPALGQHAGSTAVTNRGLQPGATPESLDAAVYAQNGNAGNTFQGRREGDAAATARNDADIRGRTTVAEIERLRANEVAQSGPLGANETRNIPPSAAATTGAQPGPQSGVLSVGAGETVIPPGGAPVTGQQTGEPRNYQVLDANGEVVRVVASRDGRTDINTNQPIVGPGERLGQVVNVLANNPIDAGGPTNSNRTDANRLDAEITVGRALVQNLRGLMAANPGIFGVVGGVQGMAQNAQQVVREVRAAIAGAAPEGAAALTSMDAALARIAPDYNPAIPQARHALLSLAYAQARLENPGGEVSRQALQRNLESLGGDRALSNNAEVEAALQSFEKNLAIRAQAAQTLRGRNGQPAAAPGAPGAPAPAAAPAASNEPVEGDFIVNPQTRERLQLRNGQWVPAP